MIESFRGKEPKISVGAYITSTSVLIGDVRLGANSSVWYGAILRADINFIQVGERTNIQDNTVIHVTRKTPTIIGDNVTIGHNATLHGCLVQSRVIIGMGAVILDGAEIGEDCIVAAGCVVSPGTKVAPGTLVMGVPSRMKRRLRPSEKEYILQNAENYVNLIREYRQC